MTWARSAAAPPIRAFTTSAPATATDQFSLTSPLRQGILSKCGIGEPARKHGVIDADIWHAVRTAMRQVVVDEDLTMLIGPASDGALLEMGILDIDGEDPVVIHAMALRPKFYRFLG